MGLSLSMDLRERIAAAIEAKEATHEAIAERFHVSVSSVERISRRLRENEGLEPRRPLGPKPKLEQRHRDFIRATLEEDPYLSSYAVAERFNKRFRALDVHRSTILRAMHDLGLSFKKNSVRSPARPT